MKSIKQIEEQLKNAGLTGNAFKDEFHRQALVFAKQLIEDIFSGYGLSNFDFKDAAVCMAHLSEIFVYAARDNFYHDFAEQFQIEVFNASHDHTVAFCDWNDKMFEGKTSDEEKSEIKTGEETDAAYPTGESGVEKPKFAAVPEEIKEADKLSSETYSEREDQTLEEIAEQLEMALTSDQTSEGVKDCLKTIIYEASGEANLGLTDLSLIRAAFPKFIKALPKEYGRGVYHSLHAILQFDTEAWKEFHDRAPDLKSLAEQLSALMHNPLLPARLYNVIGDEILEIGDIHSPENVLLNLEKLSVED